MKNLSMSALSILEGTSTNNFQPLIIKALRQRDQQINYGTSLFRTALSVAQDRFVQNGIISGTALHLHFTFLSQSFFKRIKNKIPQLVLK